MKIVKHCITYETLLCIYSILLVTFLNYLSLPPQKDLLYQPDTFQSILFPLTVSINFQVRKRCDRSFVRIGGAAALSPGTRLSAGGRMMNEQGVCSVSRSTDGGPAGQLFKFFKVINQINKSLNELSSMFPS